MVLTRSQRRKLGQQKQLQPKRPARGRRRRGQPISPTIIENSESSHDDSNSPLPPQRSTPAIPRSAKEIKSKSKSKQTPKNTPKNAAKLARAKTVTPKRKTNKASASNDNVTIDDTQAASQQRDQPLINASKEQIFHMMNNQLYQFVSHFNIVNPTHKTLKVTLRFNFTLLNLKFCDIIYLYIILTLF